MVIVSREATLFFILTYLRPRSHHLGFYLKVLICTISCLFVARGTSGADPIVCREFRRLHAGSGGFCLIHIRASRITSRPYVSVYPARAAPALRLIESQGERGINKVQCGLVRDLVSGRLDKQCCTQAGQCRRCRLSAVSTLATSATSHPIRPTIWGRNSRTN